MTSLNANVTELHRVYCESMAIEPEDLPMTMTFEDWWLRAHISGVTCDHVRLVVKARLSFNRTSGMRKGVELRHLIRSDEDVSILINEVAAIRAQQRVKVLDPAKASVLASTHRPPTVPETPAVHVGDLKLLADLRKAAQ